jgi:hypothetical protein
MSTVAVDVCDILDVLSIVAEVLACLNAFDLVLFAFGGADYPTFFGLRAGTLEIWVVPVNTSIEDGNLDRLVREDMLKAAAVNPR